MGILDDVSAALDPGLVCKYVRQLEAAREEDPDGVKELEGHASAGALKPPAVARILTNNGYKVADKTVALHLGGRCCCTA